VKVQLYSCPAFLPNFSAIQPADSHPLYEGHSKIKERFAIKKYLLIIRKKKNMQVFITHLHLLLHIVILDIEALVEP
jgi:hypothetical protein